ncbi:hypothetical protein PTSG_11942 [Salpingoeca rosetta]|uniref:Uncharacterized protein n=1 Tax=Salpingoeca rosetta (strain ATCC 50818 / BSB-021) TaxID=946362 RepID=F2U3T7_SALR5|nr:uncharacterized protein PTSG_11942 [Salpingoeca rosetta]EGD82281.1 hypothetical protein PTSG_11942 [Salpingoeca rosetta]|eukprot:XP_004996464.1 hypothetical protein PTSG_11942 [Salpingoeca rosetta]
MPAEKGIIHYGYIPRSTSSGTRGAGGDLTGIQRPQLQCPSQQIVRRCLLMLAINTAPHAAIAVQWSGGVLASNRNINDEHQEAPPANAESVLVIDPVR